MTTPPADPDRYGRRMSVTTWALLATTALTVVGLVGWFIWTIMLAGSPKVTSAIGSQDLNGDTQVTFTYTVHLGDGVNAADVRCTVSAQAKDFSTVGGPAVITPPAAGAQHYTLRTSRHAVYVNWSGCTAPGQPNPR